MEDFGFVGAGISAADIARITTLENNEYKVTYYEIISGTSGSLTVPSQATINAGEFGLSGNAILSKIDGSNKPTFESPTTSSGVIVTASLNVSTGAWVASGTYTDPFVALIYSIKIKAVYYSNLTYANIIETAITNYVTLDTAQTLTNKRITQRVTSITSSATPTPNSDTTDEYTITALAAAALLTNPTGTPTEGQTLLVRIKDNGTARALTFDTLYRFSSDQPAPTTTVINKTLYMGFTYNFTDTKWDCLGYINNI